MKKVEAEADYTVRSDSPNQSFRTIIITAAHMQQIKQVGPDRIQYEITIPTRPLTATENDVLRSLFPDLEAGVDKLLTKQALLSCFD